MLYILILLSAYAVVKIVMQISAERKCLTNGEIRRFVSKRLSVNEERRVIAHLGICENC
jgi:hypothetical protein